MLLKTLEIIQEIYLNLLNKFIKVKNNNFKLKKDSDETLNKKQDLETLAELTAARF